MEKKLSLCIECKDHVARYWGSNLCEECFREILKEKIASEDEQA
jgi:ribosomal protein L34E